ncbi:hypothetical protein JOM56_004865 [Amanita muscaria]
MNCDASLYISLAISAPPLALVMSIIIGEAALSQSPSSIFRFFFLLCGGGSGATSAAASSVVSGYDGCDV